MNRAKLLLVDESPADLDRTREGLRRSRQRFQVSTVNDGAEAICYLRRQGKYAQTARPDLIVLDLNLPRVDGRGGAGGTEERSGSDAPFRAGLSH